MIPLTSPLSRLIELNQKRHLKFQNFYSITNLPRTHFLASSILEKKHILHLRYSPIIHPFPSKELVEGNQAQKALRQLEETTLRNMNETLLFQKHIEFPMIELFQAEKLLRNSTFRVKTFFHDANNYVMSIRTDLPAIPLFVEELYDEINKHFGINCAEIVKMGQQERLYMMKKTLPKHFFTKKKSPKWVLRGALCHVSVKKPSPNSVQIKFEDVTFTISVYAIGEDKESRLFEALTKKNPFCTVVLYSLRKCVALFEQEGLEFVQDSNEFDLLRTSLERLTEEELESMKILNKQNKSFLNDLNLIRLQEQVLEESKEEIQGTSVLANLDYVKPKIVQENESILSSANDMNGVSDAIGQDQSTLDMSFSFYPAIAEKEDLETSVYGK